MKLINAEVEDDQFETSMYIKMVQADLVNIVTICIYIYICVCSNGIFSFTDCYR